MLTITGKPEIIGFMQGKPVARLDMQASTAAELPSKGDEVGGYIVAAPSTAQIIQLGKFATLDDNDSWYAAGTGDVIETGAGGGTK